MLEKVFVVLLVIVISALVGVISYIYGYFKALLDIKEDLEKRPVKKGLRDVRRR